MPAVTSGKVLVTGANGFVAVWVVKTLLERGFAVRGTIRSSSKGTYLQQLFKDYRDKFELVVVSDITKKGAFDEYVKDVDAIEHTASPFHMHADDPQEMIVPAVEGTLNILESAKTFGNAVKRVVITSSTAAVGEIGDPNPRVFSENDWNKQSITEIETKGRHASPAHKYRASKTLAERAAWEFYEKNKQSVGFDVAVVNAPFIYGPVLHEVGTPEELNRSMEEWWINVIKGQDDKFLATMGMCWTDVRDVAEAHVLALDKEAAGGKRLIVSKDACKWQDWVTAAHAINPKIAPGNATYDPNLAQHLTRYNGRNTGQILGLIYHELPETTQAILDNFTEKGWL